VAALAEAVQEALVKQYQHPAPEAVYSFD